MKNVFLNESEDNTKYAEILKELRAHIMVSNMYADKKKRKNTGENITHLWLKEWSQVRDFWHRKKNG